MIYNSNDYKSKMLRRIFGP